MNSCLLRIIPRAIVAMLALASVSLLVQPAEPWAQSKYNLVFLGQRMESGDARSIALGGSMQLLDDSLSVLQFNPAALTVARKVTFGTSQYFSSDRGQSDQLSEQDASFKFGSFVFAVPVTSRVTFAVGYRGSYDAGGHILTQKTAPAGEEYGEFYNRQGGLTAFPISCAVHVSRMLRVGAYYSIEKGSYESRWDIVFADKSRNIATSSTESDMKGRGFGAGVILQPLNSVMLGAAFDGAIDYDTEVRERHTNSSSNRAYTETTTVPARWAFSLLWTPVLGYAAHGMYSFSDFKKFNGLAFPSDRLARSEVAALGLEYTKGFRVRGLRFPLRGSVTYERMPYEFPAGESITKLLFGFGTGLQFRSGRGKLDITIQGGSEGDRENNGLSNRILRVYIGVSSSEIWKSERQDEY